MDIDGSYYDSDPGTTSNTSAPDTSASGGSDPSPFDPFSADAETFFGGVTSGSSGLGGYREESGRSSPSSDTLYDAAIYDAIAGLTAPAAPVGMSPAVADVLRDYQDRFGGSGDLAGLGVTFNTPIDIGGSPVPAAVGTPPTQSSTFDRPAYGDSSTAYRQAIDALSRMGYGNMEGANPNNPTQTVDQMIAANNVSNFLEKYAPTIFGALTGFGPHLNAIRMGADVLSGKTTPGQAILGVGLGALADKIGIPPQTLSNVAQGRLGDAAGSLATGAATGLLGSQLGLGPFSGPAAGIIMKETGLGPLIGSNVDRAVTDVVPDQNWNLLNTVGGGIDQVLKDMGLPVYSDTQYRGEPITPSLPSLPGASDYGNFYESGDSGQSGAPTTPTTPTTPEPPKQEQTITLQPRTALQPEIYQGRYGPLMRYNYVPVGD